MQHFSRSVALALLQPVHLTASAFYYSLFIYLFVIERLSSEFASHPAFLSGLCGVIEQKDEGGQQPDTACGAQTQPGHAGLCEYDAFHGSSFYLDGDAVVLCATLPLLFRRIGFQTKGKT